MKPNLEPLRAARLRIVSDNGQPVSRLLAPGLRRQTRIARIYLPRIEVDALAPVLHLPGLAWAVFLAIRFEVAVKKHRTVKLSNHILWQRWRVRPAAKRHGLHVLEEAGLITVEHRVSASPLVTLLSERVQRHAQQR